MLWLFKPFAKAIFLTLSAAVTAVLAAAYIVEITKASPDGHQALAWRDSLNSSSFYGLVVVSLLILLYTWGMVRSDRQIQKALTNARAREEAYNALMPAFLEYMKREIGAGKLTSLSEVMRRFKLDDDQP
jgi:hypothetical protein